MPNCVKFYPFLLVCVLTFFFTACKKRDELSRQQLVTNGGNNITTFRFTLDHNGNRMVDSVSCTIQNDTIKGLVPTAGISLDSLVADFSTGAAKVEVNGTLQQSGITPNNFTQPLVYKLTDNKGTVHNYVVQLTKFTGLPIVYITTTGGQPVVSKDDYINGHVTIDSNSVAFNSYDGDMQIKGHGNTTWNMPKKPYKIKLSSKGALLGMPADKEWILLANYDDKSLLRNSLAFETSKLFGMAYTPRSQFVELFFNGAYQGNYQLTEEVKISNDRLNIKDLDADDVSASKITGGYLVEADDKLGQPYWFSTAHGVAVNFHDPDGAVPAQFNYLQSYIQQAENTLYSDSFTNAANGYRQFYDVNSFINWYWVNEIFKNNDAIMYSSCYFYKDRDSILKMGPVWDFDIAGGNIDYSDCKNPQGWWIRNAPWYSRLFADSAFALQASQRFEALKSQVQQLISTIDARGAALHYSQLQNFKTWNILNIYVWPNAAVPGSYQGELDYLKQWLTTRIQWIDAQVSSTGGRRR